MVEDSQTTLTKILPNIKYRVNENPRKTLKTQLVQETIKFVCEGKRLRIAKKTFFFLFCKNIRWEASFYQSSRLTLQLAKISKTTLEY